MSIEVVLADDHHLCRHGLRLLLEKIPRLSIVAEASDGRVAVEQVLRMKPHLAIIDISMPELNGIEATRQIKTHCPKTVVLALTMLTDQLPVSEMLRAGASGYLLKSCTFEELERAIQAVLDGNVYLSPKIAGPVVEGFIRATDLAEPPHAKTLTAREREVLQLVAEGWTTKAIADALFVSVKTIEAHRKQIMQKLGIHSIAGLTKYAVQAGLTSPQHTERTS
jgi:DNA-binding NarL/FixJ family response regulator